MIRGKLALEAKRFEEAAAEFRKAIESDQGGIAAYVNLGGTLTQLGDLTGAAGQFEKALRLDPNNFTAHFNLAVLAAKNSQHQQAVEHLKTALTTNQNDLETRMFLARELSKSNRLDEAILEFGRAHESDPGNEAAMIELAQLLQNRGEFKAALVLLEKSHAQYPQKINTRLMLTFALAASPQIDLRDGPRALKLAQEMYAINPSLQNGTLVVLSLAEVGRCSDAAEVQRKLIEEAGKQSNQELLEKLKADLSRYENVRTCRQ